MPRSLLWRGLAPKLAAYLLTVAMWDRWQALVGVWPLEAARWEDWHQPRLCRLLAPWFGRATNPVPGTPGLLGTFVASTLFVSAVTLLVSRQFARH